MLKNLRSSKKKRKKQENRQTEGREEQTWGLLPFPSEKESNEIFRKLGVDYIIEGGQTMNPSTEDMLEAIEKVNAKSHFHLSE